VKRLTPEQPKASYRSATFDASGEELVHRFRIAAVTSSSSIKSMSAAKEWKPLSRHIKWDVENVALLRRRQDARLRHQ